MELEKQDLILIIGEQTVKNRLLENELAKTKEELQQARRIIADIENDRLEKEAENGS
jgi:predicted molibdopterin-dependent oxidoreductase YjgC